MPAPATAKRFDLHLHSDRSDGELPPEAVLERCAEGGLQVVALTDHDLSTELEPGTWELGGRQLTLIAGCEVSGAHDDHEYHLLVYFPRTIPDAFRAFCVDRVRERAQRYQHAVDSLALPGLPDADADAAQGLRALTRHHLARALVDAGHACDLRDAFRRYADHHHGHVRTLSLPFVDAIRIAREAGGVTSWAHPPLAALEAHLPTFVAAGLQGLEGLRPCMTSADRRRVARFAHQHRLFLTGGSDWHGWHAPDPGLFSVDRQALAGFLAALEAAA